jgi:hypothetical protein
MVPLRFAPSCAVKLCEAIILLLCCAHCCSFSCGTRSSTCWMHDFTYCKPCGDLYSKGYEAVFVGYSSLLSLLPFVGYSFASLRFPGLLLIHFGYRHFCKLCGGTYDNEDMSVHMILCDHCQTWYFTPSLHFFSGLTCFRLSSDRSLSGLYLSSLSLRSLPLSFALSLSGVFAWPRAYPQRPPQGARSLRLYLRCRVRAAIRERHPRILVSTVSADGLAFCRSLWVGRGIAGIGYHTEAFLCFCLNCCFFVLSSFFICLPWVLL